MNASIPNSRGEDAAGDGVDRLLQDFFRRELPARFPPLPFERVSPSCPGEPSVRPAGSLHSRIVLVVSVVLVLLASLFVIGRRSDSHLRPQGGLNNSTAQPFHPLAK